VARKEVSRWSCWAQHFYGSSDKAWKDLVVAPFGPTITTVSWYKFAGMWNKWLQATSQLSWQYAFTLIDADKDQEVTFEEFDRGFSTCVPEAAQEGGGSSFSVGWMVILLVGCCILAALANSLRKTEELTQRDMSLSSEIVSRSAHKHDEEKGVYQMAEAPLLQSVAHAYHQTVYTEVEESVAPLVEGVWEHKKPPPKKARGCTDACGTDGGGLLECMGLRSTAVHTWACPCNISHASTKPVCTHCGAQRPREVNHPVMVPIHGPGSGLETVHVRVPMEAPHSAAPAYEEQHIDVSHHWAMSKEHYEDREERLPEPYHEDRLPEPYHEDNYSPPLSPQPVDEIDATIQTMFRSMDAVDVQEDGCEFLKNACSTQEGVEKIERHGGIEVIIKSMQAHQSSAHLQDQAIAAIVRFVHSRSSEVSRLGGIEAIMMAMRKHPANEQVQEKGCEALQQLSMTPEDRARVVHGGGIELIEQAMQAHHEVAGVQECSCLAMGNLAFEAEGRELIAKYGGIRAIIQAMNEHINDRGVQEAACFVLHNMACTPEYTRKIADLGGVQAIREGQRVHPSLQEQEEANEALEILMGG